MNRFFTVYFSLLSLFSIASAATVVSWGPDSTIKSSGQDNLSVNNGSRAVNFGSFSSPTQGPSYYPNDTGKTPDFYGASFSILRSDGVPNPTDTIQNTTWRVVDNGGSDPDLLLNNTPNGPAGDSGYDNEVHTAYIWTENEFLTMANSLTGMALANSDNGSGTSTEVRFLIRLGVDFYASEVFGESSSLSFADPSTVTWNAYDPTTDIADFSAGAAPLTDFTDLTAAGFYVTSSGGRFIRNTSSFFEVTAVPEPSAICLTCLAMLALGTRRRG